MVVPQMHEIQKTTIHDVHQGWNPIPVWLCLIIVHLRKDLVDTLGAPEVVPGVKSTSGNLVNCRFAHFQCAAFT
jgi:hypothetical protein